MPVLYSYFRSSCAWRVRIVLSLKNVDYDYKAVHLVKGEQKEKEYSKNFNPMQQVPAFELDSGEVLSQSVAIMEYLEEMYPQTPLLPKDPLQKAKVREIVEVIASGTQPLQNLSVMNCAREAPEERKKWSHDYIRKGLAAVEQLLSKCSGEFCVGNSVTLADCCLVPQVFNANRFQVDMDQFPQISTIMARLESMEAFKRAHPKAQPDCPPELK